MHLIMTPIYISILINLCKKKLKLNTRQPLSSKYQNKTLNLSTKGEEVLKKLFVSFDFDKDKNLKPTELEFAFKIMNFNPFENEDLILDKIDDKLTLKGWMSLWKYELWKLKLV
jgi:Ca2+-binding EF-hand superfamily protein